MYCLNARSYHTHGMHEPKWTIHAKVQQYRQMIILEEKDLSVKEYQKETKKRRDEKLISDLRLEVKHKQDDLRNALGGNQRKVWSTLSERECLQRAFGYRTSDVVSEHLQKEIDLKRRKCDLIQYRKRKLMVSYNDIVLKASIMEDKILVERANIKSAMEKKRQTIALQVQNSNIRKIAAEDIRSTYSAILQLLRKDRIYYDCVLDSFKKDLGVQCGMLLAVTEMGQVVMEYTDDLKQECNAIESGIKTNMAIRDRSLETYRNLKQHLEKSLSKLVPTGSQFPIRSQSDVMPTIHISLALELEEMNKIFNTIRTVARVDKIDDINQITFRQQILRGRFQNKIGFLEKARNKLRNNLPNIEFYLGLIQHTYNEEKIAYLEKKRNLLREIRKEQRRRQRVFDANESKHDLLQSLRLQFNHMKTLLKIVRSKEESGESSVQHIEHLIGLGGKVPISMKDTREVCDGVKKKLAILWNAFEPGGHVTQLVERFFDNASREEYYGGDTDDIDLLAGIMFEDAHVPTYKSIKALSDRVVKDNTVDELALVAEQVKAKRKPGAIYRKLFLEEKKRRKRNACAL